MIVGKNEFGHFPQAGPGHSAEPEPEEVSAVPVSVPNADGYSDALSWRLRGLNLASKAVEQWPFMDWDAAANAAHCFTICAALRDQSGVKEERNAATR